MNKNRVRHFSIDSQFLFFMIQNVCIGIFDRIDSSFSNHIDIDSICVMSSFVVISWITYHAYNMGSYIFRLKLKDFKLNCIIQMISSIVTGLIIFSLRSKIPYIWSLTDNQYKLFEQCLLVHAISCPILSLREYLGNYLEYTCKNKVAAIGNIILYISMIITDIYVVMWGNNNVVDLLTCTTICSVLYIIYTGYNVTSNIKNEPFNFEWSTLKEYIGHGLNILLERMSGKVATVFFSTYASKLGTYQYSIHAIAYNLGVFTEYFPEAIYTFCIVSAAKVADSDKFKECIKIMKKYSVFIIICSYVINYIMLIFLHGKAPFMECFIWTGVYSLEILSMIVYQTLNGYLSSRSASKYMKYCGFIGIITRIPYVYIGYNLGLGLIVFATAALFDYSMRALYLYIISKKGI